METIKVSGRITNEERETHLWYDYLDKTWKMYSCVPKHFHKAQKQNWTPLKEWVYDDGVVCAMELVAPGNAITIRNPNKKQMSDKQLENLDVDED